MFNNKRERMKVKCHNIGKISDADIDIHKITLIAGLNSTGKSTIGKSLFCIFNALYEYDERIVLLKESFISDELSRANPLSSLKGISAEKQIKKWVDVLVKSDNVSVEKIQNIINNIITPNLLENKSNEIAKEIASILQTTNNDFVKFFVFDLLRDEFNKQVQTSNKINERSSISLTIQNKDITASLANNDVIDVDNAENLKTRAIYIDDPFILDSLNHPFSGPRHQQELIRRLIAQPKNDSEEIARKLILTKKLNRILEKISSACDGNIYQKDQEFSFQEKKTGERLNIKNLSTGLKTFVIIKMLLENGSLEQNGTLILDEPEVHLHPEWQKIFAEVIVLIQVEFGMHILINSHSPYFIEAIDIYEQKYGIRDNCNFYLANRENGMFENVSNDLEPVYSLLFAPLQHMENERAELSDVKNDGALEEIFNG